MSLSFYVANVTIITSSHFSFHLNTLLNVAECILASTKHNLGKFLSSTSEEIGLFCFLAPLLGKDVEALLLHSSLRTHSPPTIQHNIKVKILLYGILTNCGFNI